MSSFLEQPRIFDAAPAFPGAATCFGEHRRRLRRRFEAGGSNALSDCELLELQLSRISPGCDVKDLARSLIDRFGDLGGVLAARRERLVQVAGLDPDIAVELNLTDAITRRSLRSRTLNRPVVSSWQALLDYCHATLSRETTERFRVLFLDTKNILIADEEQARGTVDHVPVYPREVVKRALELDAKALILVHNHPSGDPTPSLADIEMTKRIYDGCRVLDLVLHDHIIVGHGRETSFRAEGYL